MFLLIVSWLVGWLLVFFVIAASGKRKHITVASMRIIMGHRKKNRTKHEHRTHSYTHTNTHCLILICTIRRKILYDTLHHWMTLNRKGKEIRVCVLRCDAMQCKLKSIVENMLRCICFCMTFNQMRL